MEWRSCLSREFGDFQTPPELVTQILCCLAKLNKAWTRVLEPTCGSGAFIEGLLHLSKPPSEIMGIEIQDHHLRMSERLMGRADGTRVLIKKGDFFHLNVATDLSWTTGGPLLVIGNPPWVTSSELGVLASNNLPKKRNLKKFRGIEALTGDSNFDIAEYIWIKILKDFASEKPAIALLCKTVVARNVLKYAIKHGFPITDAFIRRIDAKKWFDASVDACLFYVELGNELAVSEVPVFSNLSSTVPESTTGLVKGQLVSNWENYQEFAFIDGVSPVEWRQGVKHDAASVMELLRHEDHYKNGLGDNVDIEPEWVFPLLKSSDLFRGECFTSRLAVIVTQKKLGQDTAHLALDAPKLWKYLNLHRQHFANRKSSIYFNQPEFALFGVGTYSFLPYKVAISGLYKNPRFRAVPPQEECPVMFDDTCYFLGFESPEAVAFFTALFNDLLCLGFLNSVLFTDSKRPITKKLLQRINIKAIIEHADNTVLFKRAEAEFKALTRCEQKHSWQEIIEKYIPSKINPASAQQSSFHAIWH
jgi:hypothetical protein